MRRLVLALVLAVGFVTFVVIAAVTSGPEASPDDFREHRPETDDEKAAARVVIVYVSPGPLEDVSVRRIGKLWRVVGKSGGFGLA